MSRINPDFRKELSRRESSINILNEFLKYAKIEQDLHDRIRNLSIDSQQLYSNFNRPSIPSLTATVNPSKQYYHKIKHNNPSSHSTQLHSSVSRRNSVPALGNRTSTIHNTKQIQNYTSQSTLKQNPINTGSTSQHQFNNCKRKQLPDEPITFYYGDIINLCLEIDSNISEKIIIQHLMSSINPDFRKELLRRESSINTLNEFLKYAKIEQDLRDRIRNLSIDSQQLYSNFNRPSIP
ncbi:unnamed protein product [Rotaria sordida]|uniref:Uncharacterized protein n=1 Tax=Rotaria sordida TaxID=392033 RepID=A0A814JWG4_9BILA|nr:unnamed protein product [Rotaria sordida]